MTKTLHSIAHWFHQQPVAHIAWACTAVAVILTALVILPNAFRRLRTSGNRAPWRIVALVVLTGLGLATLAEIDHGYRVHIGMASASFTQ
ncbi:MAG TPA: hypothetical protein VG815_16525, partial [Chloroflexota bacterium]|nr:hypothetical protein [Chloroflexota bacterium]